MQTISFTGGYGAQIISAAAYFYLKKTGKSVGAYLRYFAEPPHLAVPGVRGDVSHWRWELDKFGIKPEDFMQPSVTNRTDVIWDGPEKTMLGFQGLSEPEIVKLFALSDEALNKKTQMFGSERFACIHIRRGDYLNVASHMVPDEAFLRVSKRIGSLVNNMLVVSDSPLSETMRHGLAMLNVNCIQAIGGEAHLVHGLMRLSDVFVASNSQFSLTAAALKGDTGLTLYPARHDDDPQSYSNRFLESMREFQVITKLL